jgi:hypothetical protein
MSKKLCAVAAAVGALAWAGPAMASGGGGGPGGSQVGIQAANTQQWADSTAVSAQNAVNANVPVTIAGGDVSSGASTATQNADSHASSEAKNESGTTQNQTQTQNVGGSACTVGCGGAGGAQIGAQVANTQQDADSKAISKQNAVNANVPVSIAGGDVTSGSSTANQTADSHAKSKATNDSETTQTQTQNQTVGGGSSCVVGCGGDGGAQIGAQIGNTQQNYDSKAISKQNAVNANVPVAIAGGDVTSGDSTATQKADSSAKSKAKNEAETTQTQNQAQNVGGSSSCKLGCGGAGGFQAGVQLSNTQQWADSKAISDQNAVNANTPVAIAGGDVSTGSSTADQTTDSYASSKAKNDAETTQNQTQTQNVGGGSSCLAGCGGPGGAQIGAQLANTQQWADSKAISKQNAVNGNAPVDVGGGDVYAGDSSATQNAHSSVRSKAKNDAETTQGQEQTQNVGSADGCGCTRSVKDRPDCGCGEVGSGGAGAFRLGVQKANTQQWAHSFALSKQNAVNSNAPHSTAGGDISSGSTSAIQNPSSYAKSKGTNDAETTQCQRQAQNADSGRGGNCGHGSKPGYAVKRGREPSGTYDRTDGRNEW